MAPNRRTFLAMLGSAAAGALAVPSVLRGAGPVTAGVQLYTLRAAMEQDVDAALAAVAAIGYRSVEFAGYFGRTPVQVRELLDRHGLTAPSAHVSFAATGDAWPRTLADAAAIGHEYVTVPSLPTAARSDLDAWRRTAERFNTAAAAAREAGLRFAFHNHEVELRAAGDVVPLQLLIEETDPDLVTFQLDVYWVTRADHDPVNWLTLYPGRFSMLHLKDTAGPPDHRMVDVGAGVIDFRAVLAAAATGGVRHSFVEHDRPADPMASIRASYAWLSGL